MLPVCHKVIWNNLNGNCNANLIFSGIGVALLQFPKKLRPVSWLEFQERWGQPKGLQERKRGHETSWNSANARFSNFRVSVFFLSLSQAVCFQMSKGNRKARKPTSSHSIVDDFQYSKEMSICFLDRDLILVGDVTLWNSRGKPSGSILNAKERRVHKWHRT